MTSVVSDELGGVCTGVSVMIKRSDGRVHASKVTAVDLEQRVVTVEFVENGQTKAKIEGLDQIFSLNDQLAPQQRGYGHTEPKPRVLSARNRNSILVTNPKKPPPAADYKDFNNPEEETENVQVDKMPPPASRSGRTGRSMAPEQMPPSRLPSKERKSTVNTTKTTTGASRRKSMLQDAQKQVKAVAPPSRNDAVSRVAATAADNRRRSDIPPVRNEAVSRLAEGGINDSRRRSGAVGTVKEVDKIKENREKRRAQQAKVLEEKIDYGHPNWQFLQMICEYKEELEFQPLQDGDPVFDHKITVCVRKRPLSDKEIKRREIDVATCPSRNQVIVHQPMTKVDLTKYLENQNFRYDYAFDETQSNEMVYKYSARPLVHSIFEGGMATCFAYGQTGSGKTHTMGGEFHGKSQDCANGIYAFATRDVFELLDSDKYGHLDIHVGCSYFEIYGGKVFDLLSGKSKLRVLEDGKQQVVVVGLTEKIVASVEDVLQLISHGNKIRTSGQTSANQNSSRSHAVFQIILRNTNRKRSLYGKFSLIDLAGNERGADTASADRQTRMEGAEINKSLLALKECIRALGRKGAHLPFRASTLTQVLRDSFVGDKAKTCMIAMISPSFSSCEHTLNTLRYADRVKELGATDPAKGSDGKNANSPGDRDGLAAANNSGLDQLRSLNDGECNDEWYSFQEKVAHLQELEEDLVESHKNLYDNMDHWMEQDASLLAITNEVDYDQDVYAQKLEDLISEKQQHLADLKEKCGVFRNCLKEEEQQSRNMNIRK